MLAEPSGAVFSGCKLGLLRISSVYSDICGFCATCLWSDTKQCLTDKFISLLLSILPEICMLVEFSSRVYFHFYKNSRKLRLGMMKVTKISIKLLLSTPSKYWNNHLNIIISFCFTIIQEKNHSVVKHFYNVCMCSIMVWSKSLCNNNYNFSFL